MALVNNVDLGKIAQTVEGGKRDPATLRKRIKLSGEWILEPSAGYQFRTEVAFEKGRKVIEVDSPSYLGGAGNALGPMAFCVAGITSCFISTFATVAAMHEVRLTMLKVNTECTVNFAKTLDLADEPITEGIDFAIQVESSNADKRRLQEIAAMAEERCPAIYSMTHVIGVKARVV